MQRNYVMFPKLSLDKTLLKAKQYANKGNFEKAKMLYEQVLTVFSKNKGASHEFG